MSADKVSVIEPIDSLVIYGNDGRCYATQGCSIMGLLAFRRWNKVFLEEVGKISQVVKSQSLFTNAKFLDFYSLSLGWENDEVFAVIFPYWMDWAREDGEAEGLSGDDLEDYVEEKFSEFIGAALATCTEFNFTGPTLAIACNQMLMLNGLEPENIPPKTLYQLLFDHVGADDVIHPGKLIALNKPESYKRPRVPGAPPEPEEPPSDLDPTYQAIAGLVSITQDLEKALSIADQFPAKLINGVGAAIAEQQERQRAKSGAPGQTGAPGKALTPEEVNTVLASFNAPI